MSERAGIPDDLWQPPEHNCVMVKLPQGDGERRSFRCDCGANCFHYIAENKLACNACDAIYIAE